MEQRHIADQALVLGPGGEQAEGVVTPGQGQAGVERIGLQAARVAQVEVLVETEQVARLQAKAQAPRAGGRAALVVGPQPGAPDRRRRRIDELEHRASRALPGHDAHLGLPATQTVELVKPLLDVPQLQDVAHPHGQSQAHAGGIQGIVRQHTAVVADGFDAARHDAQAEHTARQVLAHHVGPGGDQTRLDEVGVEPLQQQADAYSAQVKAGEGPQAASQNTRRQQLPALQFDVLDTKHGRDLGHLGRIRPHRGRGGGLLNAWRGLAQQALPLTLHLLTQDAVALVLARWRRRLLLGMGAHSGQQKGQGERKVPLPFNARTH